MIYAPTSIDLSRVPAPDVIEALSYDTLRAGFVERFLVFWGVLRETDSSLPAYDVNSLETDPGIIFGETWSYLRLLDRQRVNDAVKALLAPLAKKADLENIVAGRNIQRITIAAATASADAIMESDVALLRRYLLSFDAPCAGSAGRYLHDAWTAWPAGDDGSGMLHARVNGRAIHGRRGDTDVVIIGPSGRLPTEAELATVRAGVTDANRAPEAVAISVMAATRREYQGHLVIEVPGMGVAPAVLQAEAVSRVTAAASVRLLIGGEIPAGYLSSAAYGDGIIKVRDLAPVTVEPDAYTIPVMTGLTIDVEART